MRVWTSCQVSSKGSREGTGKLGAMSTLARIFGYDPKLLPWYRDLALGCVGGIGLLYALLAFAQGSHSLWDIKFGLGSLGVAIVCTLLSPNRRWVLIVALSLIMAFGSMGLVGLAIRPFDTRSLEVVGVIVACVVAIAFLARHGDSKRNYPSYIKELSLTRRRKR
jgi:hypothetical protein